MTDRLPAAIPLALIVESAHWIRLRWNFDQNACIRAWQLSILSAGATAVFIWLDGDRLTALHRIIGWLPALFLPMQFVQAFGLKDSVPLSTFSFFARQRHIRNERLGLRDLTTRLNFGNVYLVCCLIAATLGPNARSPFFLPGILLVTGWAILASRRSRWLPLAFALGIAGAFAIAGQKTLTVLYDKAARYQRGDSPGENLNPNVVDTAIGSLGEIKLSPEIRWRLTIPENQPDPKYLRLANYNRYGGGRWKNERATRTGEKTDFLSLDEQADGNSYYVFRSQEDQPDPPPGLPYFHMRGSVKEDDQLPVPGNTAAIGGFALDSVLHNSLGTIRIIPKNSVIDGTVWWRHHPQLENPPSKGDLFIAPVELDHLNEIAKSIGLHQAPTLRAKMELLYDWYLKNFRYSRYLTIPREDPVSARTAITRFLTEDRRGHCEYFATSAALLLRASGVPTRYSIGYLVAENNGSDKFVIRGHHAHAWCRVWDESTSTWLDFDPTPPDWLGIEGRRITFSMTLADLMLRVREDFGLWRTDPDNRAGIAIGMSVIGSVALVFIGRRLWKSKRILGPARTPSGPTGPKTRTPLHELEPAAGKLLGPRPPGLPFARWLSGLKNGLVDPAKLDEAIDLHQRLRFDPAPPDSAPETRLRELVTEIKATL